VVEGQTRRHVSSLLDGHDRRRQAQPLRPMLLLQADVTINTVFPNTYQKPNIFVDEIMALLTPTTNMVLDAACRRIMGWEQHRATRRDRISLTQFRQMTGLSRPAILRALTHLRAANILTAVGDNVGGQVAREYELNLGQRGGYNWDFLREHAPRKFRPDAALAAKTTPPVAGASGKRDLPLAETQRYTEGGFSGNPGLPLAVNGVYTQNKETKKDNPIYLLWSQQALPLLRNCLPSATFGIWLADSRLEEEAPGYYLIVLPAYLGTNPNVGEWVKSHLGLVCLNTLAQFTSPVHGVTFAFQESAHEQATA